MLKLEKKIHTNSMLRMRYEAALSRRFNTYRCPKGSAEAWQRTAIAGLHSKKSTFAPTQAAYKYASAAALAPKYISIPQ